MPVETIKWENGKCRIIEQTLLPREYKIVELDTVEDVWDAIKRLAIRGAPAIGVAAAFGAYIGVKDFPGADLPAFLAKLDETCKYLASSRPTAVNLFWALERIQKLAISKTGQSVDQLKQTILDEAVAMIDEDNRICMAIGDYGAALLADGDTILTHCNAGGLATASYGTALAPVFRANEKGKRVSVIADETRPLLQGARLTAWECKQSGIPVTLICDGMSGAVMGQGKVQAVIVGTDRTAANGDVANKIGTFNLAIVAKYHNVPFYVAAPLSSIDMSLASGAEIPIEERDPREITHGFGSQTAPDGIDVYNPAFDVTPHELVTAIITEAGVVRAPYVEGLKAAFAAKERKEN
jgi:methylthioribose-1-phosphate isomerase